MEVGEKIRGGKVRGSTKGGERISGEKITREKSMIEFERRQCEHINGKRMFKY